MTHATPIDIPTLAARLRLMTLGLIVEILALLGEGPLSRALARWVRMDLGRGERGAQGLIVLAALRRLPPLPHLRRALRPLTAPRGFRRRWRRDPRLAQIVRGVFPREHDLLARARRLERTLGDIDAVARRVARRLLRPRAATQLIAIAPPAAPRPAGVAAAQDAHDTS